MTRPHALALPELLARVRPVGAHEEWEQVVVALLSSPADRDVIERLKADLDRDGRFREPIVHSDGEVGNGTHRVVAAKLAGVPTVVVRDGWPDDDSGPSTEYVEVEVTVKLLARLLVDYEEEPDAVFSILRSFPMGDGLWVESGAMVGGEGSPYELTYRLAHERREELAAAMRRRAGSFGMLLDVQRVTPQFTWRFDV